MKSFVVIYAYAAADNNCHIFRMDDRIGQHLDVRPLAECIAPLANTFKSPSDCIRIFPIAED